MIGKALVGVRTRQWVALCAGLLVCSAAQSVAAAECPGHPDALGTSRTLVVDPRAHPRIGTMQYPETLPLEDHEVVLTFDDGPLPRNSNQVLEILAAQCVKATFFTIGSMALAYPDGVRKLRDAGHSIGTHTQDHPLTMDRMSIERARQEIDDGIASVKSVLGDDAALAPFFRIPGLARADAVEGYLASQGIQTWSADFLADDWRHISPSRVYELAINRLEDKGRGIPEDSQRAEGARLSHRPRGAGDGRAAGDADGAAAMAIASGVGICRDLTLAENSEFRLRRRRHAARPVAVGPGLAGRTVDAACGTVGTGKARRSAAAGSTLAPAIGACAGQRRYRPADPGADPLRDPGRLLCVHRHALASCGPTGPGRGSNGRCRKTDFGRCRRFARDRRQAPRPRPQARRVTHVRSRIKACSARRPARAEASGSGQESSAQRFTP